MGYQFPGAAHDELHRIDERSEVMTSAYVLIQLAAGSGRTDIGQIHTALHAIQGVKTVHVLTGPTDVIAFVEVADQAALMEALGKIRGVKGVASTDTRIVMPI